MQQLQYIDLIVATAVHIHVCFLFTILKPKHELSEHYKMRNHFPVLTHDKLISFPSPLSLSKALDFI